MKTLLTGIVLGIAAKCLWDSHYGDDLRKKVNEWWNGITGRIDDGIVAVEAKIENAAEKVDQLMN